MNYLALILSLTLFITCATPQPRSVDTGSHDLLMQEAQRIAHKYIITDGHIDLPYRLKITNFRPTKEYLGIPITTKQGDFDYMRAKQGGLDAPFMSIYIPAEKQKEAGASKALADSLINMIVSITEAHPDKFQIAYTADDCDRLFKQGIIALPMGMENGAALEDDLSNVQYFNDRGISYVTLTHSKVNLICDSSYDTTRTWHGLSPYGERVVEEMNRVGIMVDISHVSDETFYDVMEITKVPVIASHSSCRKFTPEFERNMDDDMIRALGINGGVIQINFGSTFLDKAVQEQQEAARQEISTLIERRGLEDDDPEAEAIREEYKSSHPSLYADVRTVADHIDHVVSLVGVDHVGLGSDYDGVGDSLPTGLKDVSQYPNLIRELLHRGYSEGDIAKICYQNVWRVWRAVDTFAASQ